MLGSTLPSCISPKFWGIEWQDVIGPSEKYSGIIIHMELKFCCKKSIKKGVKFNVNQSG
jgi:hypothetical protein